MCGLSISHITAKQFVYGASERDGLSSNQEAVFSDFLAADLLSVASRVSAHDGKNLLIKNFSSKLF